MLFLSPHPEYQVLGIKQAKDNYNEFTGQYIDTTPGIDALFRPGACPGWAQEIALADKRFLGAWSGLPPEQPLHAYIGVYDTDKQGFDGETRQMVEETLLRHPSYGLSFVLVEVPQEVQNLPWPSYDTTHHQQVVKIAKEIGVPLDKVLEWEQSHRNRPFVVESLEKELNSVDDFVAA